MGDQLPIVKGGSGAAENTPGMSLLTRSQRSTRGAGAVCAAAVIAAALWALLVPSQRPIEAPDFAALAPAGEPPPRPLAVAAFDTPVWTIPQVVTAAPPSLPPPPPPPPPLKVQLIGIIKEEVGYKAVLYDPDTNKVRVVAAGEEVQGRRVARVAADMMTIGQGATLQTLALKTSNGVPR